MRSMLLFSYIVRLENCLCHTRADVGKLFLFFSKIGFSDLKIEIICENDRTNIMKNRHTSRMTDDGRPAPYVCRTINKSTHNTHTHILIGNVSVTDMTKLMEEIYSFNKFQCLINNSMEDQSQSYIVDSWSTTIHGKCHSKKSSQIFVFKFNYM